MTPTDIFSTGHVPDTARRRLIASPGTPRAQEPASPRAGIATRALGLVVAAALALALAPAQAGAAVVFPALQTVSATSGQAQTPQIAVDASGAATVVWNDRGGSVERIRARRIGAGGTPMAPVRTLRTADPDDVLGPVQVAIAPSGQATATWSVHPDSGLESLIEAQRISPLGGVSGGPTTLSASGELAEAPQLAVDRFGRATVVWQASDGVNTTIRARRINAAGQLGPTRVLSPLATDAIAPQIAIDDAGRATVTWAVVDPVSRVQAVRIASNGTPGTRHDLSPLGQAVRDPQVAVDPTGRALIAWVHGSEPNESVRMRRIATNASPIGSVRRASGTQAVTSIPQLAVNESGRAAIVWGQATSFEPNVYLRRMGPDGSLAPTRALSVDLEPAGEAAVAIDADGRAIATWVDSGGSGSEVNVMRTGPDGSFGPVNRLTDPGGSAGAPRVAVDGEARPTVVWSYESGSAERIALARGEIQGPVPRILAGPRNNAVTTDPMPRFDFAAEPADPRGTVSQFECRVDALAPFTCEPNEPLGPLPNGRHLFSVQAVDIEGDWGPQARRIFWVTATALPSRLGIQVARVVGGRPGNRRLAVRGSLDERAAGQPIVIAYRAAGGRVRMRTRANRAGNFRVVQRLRGRPALARGGVVAVAFRGSRVLRPGRAAVRAAQLQSRTRVGQVRVRGDRLVLGGHMALPRVRRGAGPAPRRPAELPARIEFNRPNGAPSVVATTARVSRRGFFRIQETVNPWLRFAGAYVTVTSRGGARYAGQVVGSAIEPRG